MQPLNLLTFLIKFNTDVYLKYCFFHIFSHLILDFLKNPFTEVPDIMQLTNPFDHIAIVGVRLQMKSILSSL